MSKYHVPLRVKFALHDAAEKAVGYPINKPFADAAIEAALDAWLECEMAKRAASCGDEFWYAHPVRSVTTTNKKGEEVLTDGHHHSLIIRTGAPK